MLKKEEIQPLNKEWLIQIVNDGGNLFELQNIMVWEKNDKGETINQKRKPLVLLLQETKMGDLEILQKQHKIWHDNGILFVSSLGASEGIYTLWDQSMLRLLE